MNENRPASGPVAELTEGEFREFIWALGSITFRTVGAAAFARHDRPLSTVKDYLDLLPTDPRPLALAKEYLKDLSGKMTTEELSQKWFGKSAAGLAGEMARKLDGDLP